MYRITMIIAIWYMLTNGEDYNDLGGDYYNRINLEKKAEMYLRKLADLGYTASIQPAV